MCPSQREMVRASLGLAEKRVDRHNIYPVRVVKPAPVPVAVPERRA